MQRKLFGKLFLIIFFIVAAGINAVFTLAFTVASAYVFLGAYAYKNSYRSIVSYVAIAFYFIFNIALFVLFRHLFQNKKNSNIKSAGLTISNMLLGVALISCLFVFNNILHLNEMCTSQLNQKSIIRKEINKAQAKVDQLSLSVFIPNPHLYKQPIKNSGLKGLLYGKTGKYTFSYTVKMANGTTLDSREIILTKINNNPLKIFQIINCIDLFDQKLNFIDQKLTIVYSLTTKLDNGMIIFHQNTQKPVDLPVVFESK